MKFVPVFALFALSMLLVSCTLGPMKNSKEDTNTPQVVNEEDVSQGIEEINQATDEIPQDELDNLGLDVFQ